MEDNIHFERFLYEDGSAITLSDMPFCVDRIIVLPKIRPHQLEKAVTVSAEYCKISDFRRNLLDKCNECPVLIYHLYTRDIIVFGEIEGYLRNENSFLISYYFRKEIEEFETFILKKLKPYSFDESFFENTNDLDELIEYGFHRSSIEYCLKYDDINELVGFHDLHQKAKWSPFEWSFKPDYLDLLSFSGFFGSIKCFKHLLLNGLKINENVFSMVSCSGCLDLFHLCRREQSITIENLCRACDFFHPSLLVFMIENGSDINSKDSNFWKFFVTHLLFTMQLIMVI